MCLVVLVMQSRELLMRARVFLVSLAFNLRKY